MTKLYKEGKDTLKIKISSSPCLFLVLATNTFVVIWARMTTEMNDRFSPLCLRGKEGEGEGYL